MLLNKTLYDLKQSPWAWFFKIAPTLVAFDFKQCESNPCIFIYTNDKDEKTYIALYVDDFIIVGENENNITRIKQLLTEQFDMKDLVRNGAGEERLAEEESVETIYETSLYVNREQSWKLRRYELWNL